MGTGLGVSKELDRALRAAIAARRLVNFSYQGRLRKAEPHDYGINKGKTRLFCYQVGGESRSGPLPNWRLLEVPDISGLEITEESFPGPRAVSGSHIEWDDLFASVSRPTKG
jgi:hypothetical protein